MIDDRTVSVGLLARDDLHAVGQSIARAWPVDRSSTFDVLLEAIEVADRECSLSRVESELSVEDGEAKA
jgi:hypothetical protein